MIKQYDSEEYKTLIKEFCKERGYTEKQSSYLLRPCIYEKDLFGMMPYQYMSLVINEMCGLNSKERRGWSKNPQYLRENRSYLNLFFEWCKEKGIISGNPFQDLNILQYSNLLYQMIEEMDIKVLYPEDIDEILNNIEFNRNLYEVIIRLLFEGVKNARELASIKWNDIELDFGIINLNNRKLYCTGKLLPALIEYKEDTIYYSRRNNATKIEKASLEIFHDFLIKRVDNHKSVKDLSDQKYIDLAAVRVGAYVKNFNIKVIDIVRSGLLHALRQEFDKFSDKDFCDIFIKTEKKNAGIAMKLKKVYREYGYDFNNETNTNHVTVSLIPYIVKSKYYQ